MSINDESEKSLPKADENEHDSLTKTNENEKDPLNSLEIIEINEKKRKPRYIRKNYIIVFFISFLVILAFSCLLIYKKFFTSDEFDNDEEQSNLNSKQKDLDKPIISKERNNKVQKISVTENKTPKLKMGFLYPTITPFMGSIGEYFSRTENFDIYFLVKSSEVNKRKYDDKIKILKVYDNFKLIQKVIKEEKIDFLIVHYNIKRTNLNMLKLLNTKIIGLYEEDFDCEIKKTTKTYKDLKYLMLFNTFIHTNHDEYSNYKKLGLSNNIFIPNTNNLNQSNIKSSNLNIHNIILFGTIKDNKNNIVSAIMAMRLIVKRIKDAKLNIISSDTPLPETTKLINLYKLEKNIVFYNISSFNYSCFSSSSLSIFTSLTEDYSPIINMAKSFSIPCIVSSDKTNSSIFTNGVIKVNMSNYEVLSNEIIKLLKNIKYQNAMRKRAKLSYETFKNDMMNSWIKLIDAIQNSKNDFQNVREEIENIFWNTSYQNSNKTQININENIKKEKFTQNREKTKLFSNKNETIKNKISGDKGNKLSSNKTIESKSLKHNEIENRKIKKGKNITKHKSQRHISKKDKDKSIRTKRKHSSSHRRSKGK